MGAMERAVLVAVRAVLMVEHRHAGSHSFANVERLVVNSLLHHQPSVPLGLSLVFAKTTLSHQSVTWHGAMHLLWEGVRSRGDRLCHRPPAGSAGARPGSGRPRAVQSFS